MSIRKKLLILSLLMFCSLASITGLALRNWNRLQSLNRTILLGQQLQNHSRNVIGLMKDITFDLFAPRMYGQIRALTYAPRSVAAYKVWMNAVGDYQTSFTAFVGNRELTILQDDELQDLYSTALTLNEKALNKLYDMSEVLNRLQNMETGGNDLYIIMQQDETLIPFFDQFRETSFYFTNTFESYMNHFFSSFRRQSSRLERELYIQFLLVSLIFSTMALGYALIISRQILRKIDMTGAAFENIARGDFSTVYSVRDRDELSTLLIRINELSVDLKENIDSILNLTRDMGQARYEGTSLENMLQLVADTIIKDTRAETAGVYLYDSRNQDFRLKACGGVPRKLPERIGGSESSLLRLKAGEPLISDEARHLLSDASSAPASHREPENNGEPGDILALPLTLKGECRGILIPLLSPSSERFSDLGITRMINFAEYVSLSLDNQLKYGEILEKREAQYWALQSQVQPHFIYNILSGFIGLNRMGDRDRLERAILSLREMLRYVTDQEHWTTLEEEIRFLENYCELQKIRFTERLRYSLDLKEELKSFRIPRLLLQPLVENAIIHGLEPQEEGGGLRLDARRDGDQISIRIEDDGVGCKEKFSMKDGGVGLRNVRERLAMTYPDSRFSISPSPEGGTVVEISIPNRETEEGGIL